MADTVRTCSCGKPVVLITTRTWGHADGAVYRHRIELAPGQPGATTLSEDAAELRRIAAGLGDFAVRAVLAGIAGRLDAPAPSRQEGVRG